MNAHAESIDIGNFSRELLYRIRYVDGDPEHLSADNVRTFRTGRMPEFIS